MVEGNKVISDENQIEEHSQDLEIEHSSKPDSITSFEEFSQASSSTTISSDLVKGDKMKSEIESIILENQLKESLLDTTLDFSSSIEPKHTSYRFENDSVVSSYNDFKVISQSSYTDLEYNRIPIPSGYENSYLLVFYKEFGYINCVSVQHLLSTRGSQQTWLRRDLSIKKSFFLLEKAMLIIRYRVEKEVYVKAYTTDFFTSKTDIENGMSSSVIVKKNDLESINYFIIPIKYREELKRLILTKLEVRGIPINNSIYQSEYSLLHCLLTPPKNDNNFIAPYSRDIYKLSLGFYLDFLKKNKKNYISQELYHKSIQLFRKTYQGVDRYYVRQDKTLEKELFKLSSLFVKSKFACTKYSDFFYDNINQMQYDVYGWFYTMCENTLYKQQGKLTMNLPCLPIKTPRTIKSFGIIKTLWMDVMKRSL